MVNEMARNTGVSVETSKHMILDAGAVYLNYGEQDERIFGATRAGSEFAVEQTVREIEVDGLRGPTKGFRRVVEEHIRLTVNLLEMTPENVVVALVGASSASDASEVTVTRSLAIADIEYLTNIALVADYSGSGDPVVIILYNAIADGNFMLSASDREEATTTLQFTGHFDPNGNLDASPFEIRFPVLV